MQKSKKEHKKRVNIVLPNKFVSALWLIDDVKRINMSSQIELGLQLYFRKYKRILTENNIDIWGKK